MSCLKFSRPVYVVATHVTPFIGKGHPDFIDKKHPEFGKRENPNLRDFVVTSVRGALATVPSIPPADIEALWMGNFAGELFANQGHLGASFTAAHGAFKGKPGIRTEGACASGGLAFYGAVQGILGGMDVALACGVEVQNTVTPRQGGDFLARASDYPRQRPIDDFTFPALFARRTREYLKAFPSASRAGIAAVAAKAYAAGNANKKAHMHTKKMSAADIEASPCFLNNEELKPWLKVGECSQVSDGGACVIVCSDAALKKYGIPKSAAVRIVGLGVGCGDLYTDDPLHAFHTMSGVATDMWRTTGRKAADLDLVELHDCFAVAEILGSEAIGLAPPGHGADLAVQGISAPQGKVAINPGGGLVSFGHPVGATGIKQVAEVCDGLLGKSTYTRQRNFAATVNMGGDDKTVVMGLYERAN